jgi:anti-sigma B factor antagonist
LSLLLGVCAIGTALCAREPSPAGPEHICALQRVRYPPGPRSQTRSALDSIASVSPTPFEVKDESLDGGVLTLSVRGELDLNTAPELDQPLEKALEEGPDTSVLIDLSGCEFIDSTGIALIVRAWQRVDREAGGEGRGRLAICCSNEQVDRLLKITGVESSISMFEDRDSALADLQG